MSAKLCDSSSLQSDEDGEDIQLCGSRTEHFNTAAGRSGVMDEKWTLQVKKKQLVFRVKMYETSMELRISQLSLTMFDFLCCCSVLHKNLQVYLY